MRKIADISSALSDILKEYDKEIWAEFVISSNWSKIAGKKRKAYSLKLRGGILRISTPDSTLRNFLVNQKKFVLDKINEILGEKMVNDIEVFGISQPIFKMFSQKLKSKEKTKEGE
ncbi:MAG: DciA family protein [Candidatus Calescibacterium sp.]